MSLVRKPVHVEPRDGAEKYGLPTIPSIAERFSRSERASAVHCIITSLRRNRFTFALANSGFV